MSAGWICSARFSVYPWACLKGCFAYGRHASRLRVIMKSRLAVLGMAAALALGASQANADGYVRAPAYAAPFSWTGFYLGGNVGGAWSDTQ